MKSGAPRYGPPASALFFQPQAHPLGDTRVFQFFAPRRLRDLLPLTKRKQKKTKCQKPPSAWFTRGRLSATTSHEFLSSRLGPLPLAAPQNAKKKPALLRQPVTLTAVDRACRPRALGPHEALADASLATYDHCLPRQKTRTHCPTPRQGCATPCSLRVSNSNTSSRSQHAEALLCLQ